LSPRPRWQSQKLWEPLDGYEAMAVVADLSATPEGISAYAKRTGRNRNAVAEAVKADAPELYERIMSEFGGDEVNAGRKRGASFESAVKGALARRGYYVLKTYASKSAVDLLAVGVGKPNLMVQCKRDGKLLFGEWNKLWEQAQEFGCWPVLVRRPEGENRGFEWYKLISAKEKKGLRNDEFLLPFDPREPEQTTLLAPASAVLAEA
jgi:Holliday junction resolvase